MASSTGFAVEGHDGMGGTDLAVEASAKTHGKVRIAPVQGFKYS